MNQIVVKIALAFVFVLVLAAVLVSADRPEDDGGDRFPSVYIDAFGSDVTSRDDYMPCSITVDSESHRMAGVEAGIKGRGNSTWEQPKKPYTVKFEEKIDLFGNGPAKTWVLLANHLDKSMVRNYLAYEVAEAVGAEYTTTTQFVNLFLNGEYLGIYLVAEKVQIGKERVDVGGSGFIVEMDSHAASEGEEGVDYFAVDGRNYSVTDPDCTPEQVEEIRKFMAEVWDAVGSGDWKRVQEALDVRSFALTYIVEELFHDVDVDLSSFYLHKGRDGRLHSGPIWDFDLCAGNYNTRSSNDPDRLYAAWKSVWYSSLLEYDEFRALVSETVAEKEDYIRLAIGNGLEYASRHGGEFVRNFEKWDVLDKHVDMNPFMLMALGTWQEHVDFIASWLDRSLDTLVREYRRSRRREGRGLQENVPESPRVHAVQSWGGPRPHRLQPPESVCSSTILENISPRALSSDGAYPAFYNYAEVFCKLGVVMASNTSTSSVVHVDRSIGYIRGLYSLKWRDSEYRSKASPKYMLNMLCRKGDAEKVGQFLRNLDMGRGREIAARYAKDRHVCEMVRRAMKRWMNFDVRGLCKESE
ncbi:MAG: CotH kinase family protein [Candidatus Methanomethylophilaceae archaeon]|nr:CotH kinase family protein [Candidatus Methanomethylophilaceae archaeon]